MPRRGEQIANDRRISVVTEQELIEESESRTLLERAWAFEHDVDTEDDPDPAVADPIDADPIDHLSVVADPIDDDPAVADQVEDPQAPPPSTRVRFMRPRPKVKSAPAAGTVNKLYVRGEQPLQVFDMSSDPFNLCTCKHFGSVPVRTFLGFA